MDVWYSRPVFFVESVERSIAFYTEKLGFTLGSHYAEDGKILVGQVNREDCEILLNCQQPRKDRAWAHVYFAGNRVTANTQSRI